MSPESLTKNYHEYFIETKQELDKHWKNYKFIILFYDIYEGSNDIYQYANLEALRKEGFILLNTKDIVGRYMDQPEDIIDPFYHPSAKA